MYVPPFREEQLTVVAAVLFILSVGMASSLSTKGSLLTVNVLLSAISFVYLYVSS
jgi:hypothetical protein